MLPTNITITPNEYHAFHSADEADNTCPLPLHHCHRAISASQDIEIRENEKLKEKPFRIDCIVQLSSKENPRLFIPEQKYRRRRRRQNMNAQNWINVGGIEGIEGNIVVDSGYQRHTR